MLRRLLAVIAIAVLLSFAMQGCGTGPDAYFSMQLDKVGGRPYVLLQYAPGSMDATRTYFNIYTPRGKNFDEWEAVTGDRLGPVYGTFVAQAAAPAAEGSAAAPLREQLGLFHRERVSFLDLSASPPVTTFMPLPFKWLAETAAQFNGMTYVFGVEYAEPAEPLGRDEKIKGILRAARFDGRTWEALKTDGPEVCFAADGFLLQAVTLKDGIKIFWRQAAKDQLIYSMLEGQRVVTQDNARMASFDGKAFSREAAEITGLPRGQVTAYPETDRINFLVQTVSRPGEAGYRSSPMEWRVVVPQDGLKTLDSKLVETISDPKQPQPGLFKFIAAGHAQWEGREFILRSNWQSFEVWQRGGETPWALVRRNPKGLPVSDLETMLVGMLLAGLGLIAFGAGLAYRRRKHAWNPARKILARDVYASLGVRMAAYGIDLALVFTVMVAASRHLAWDYASVEDILSYDLTRAPNLFFFGLYMAYLVLTEWLTGATLGKYIMGLRVVADNGQKAALWPVFVRNLAGFFERLPVPAPFVSMPMLIFTPRRQRLGDLLSRTYVVRKSALDAFLLQRAEALKQKELDELGLGAPDFEVKK